MQTPLKIPTYVPAFSLFFGSRYSHYQPNQLLVILRFAQTWRAGQSPIDGGLWLGSSSKKNGDFSARHVWANRRIPCIDYPLVNVNKKLWKITMLSMGSHPLFLWSFSIAKLELRWVNPLFQWVNPVFQWVNPLFQWVNGGFYGS